MKAKDLKPGSIITWSWAGKIQVISTEIQPTGDVEIYGKTLRTGIPHMATFLPETEFDIFNPPRRRGNTMSDRTAHWGTCSNQECPTSMVIYPHPDAVADLPDEDDWDDSTFFISCPVCGDSMDWGGTDHPADIIKDYPRAVTE